MKKVIYVVMILFGMNVFFVSCDTTLSSPEELGRKDARALWNAFDRQDLKAANDATEARDKHMEKFSEDPSKLGRYIKAYRDEDIKLNTSGH